HYLRHVAMSSKRNAVAVRDLHAGAQEGSDVILPERILLRCCRARFDVRCTEVREEVVAHNDQVPDQWVAICTCECYVSTELGGVEPGRILCELRVDSFRIFLGKE